MLLSAYYYYASIIYQGLALRVGITELHSLIVQTSLNCSHTNNLAKDLVI